MTEKAKQGIREHNRGRVLLALSGAVASSRSEIGRRTGLSRATVTSIVADLLDERAILTVQREQVDQGPRGVGRRAELLTLAREEGFAVALDLGHESVHVALAASDGAIEGHTSARLLRSATAEDAVRVTRELTMRTLKQANRSIVNAIGVVAAVPDPIDREGDVARPDALSRWNGRNPATMLSAALGMPVTVENDANLAVVGERLYGAARGLDDVIYVKVANGVGTGIIVNGGLVRGSDGLAGEVGHIQVRPDGHICSCGNRGCLFTLVTGHYLGPLLGNTQTGIDSITAMATREDPGANRLLKDAGYEVGKVLANLANTLNPAAVILGGRFAHAGTGLIDGLRDAMERYAEPQVARDMRITRTALRESAELLGAAAFAAGIIEGPARIRSTA